VGEITKLFGESEGLWEVGEIKKMLENEKYWKNSAICEYTIMHWTVSCWVFGEHGGRGTGEGADLIKVQCIQARSTKANLPWTINIHLKNGRSGEKNRSFFRDECPWEVVVDEKRGTGGNMVDFFVSVCENRRWNLLKCSRKVRAGERERDGGVNPTKIH
jgi:hypothetical protein